MTVTVLSPDELRKLAPDLINPDSPDIWVYRCENQAHGWVLAVATHAEPGSRMLSLGGFRIAPEERTSAAGFSAEHEAIALAIGMEAKVRWSRITGVAGPLARTHLSRIVGGKCVLVPTPEARVGQPLDTELLDFAVSAFNAIEDAAGISLITGQDLGHGNLHTGESSLSYLNSRYHGSMQANTAVPTGEGNVQLLLGMLRAIGLSPSNANVGLVGCGNIGMHVATRLHGMGARLVAMEASPVRREQLTALGVPLWLPENREEFLAQPVDALVVNALGGSLDSAGVAACSANPRLRVICGSENLVMPDPDSARVLGNAGKIYAPTELGGMVGYLTAVEEYLARQRGHELQVEELFPAAAALELVGYEATKRVVESGNAELFQDAVTAIHSTR